MKVHRDINSLPLFKNAVITIGTFDGVHTGHLQIIRQLKDEATKIGGETVIITFHPHPRMVVQPLPGNDKPGIMLLNTLDEKIALLEKQSIDHLVIVPFDNTFSDQSAEVYIRDFLTAKFHPHTIIIGYDHHFGKGRSGNYKLLEKYGPQFNYQVKEIPEHVLNHVAISSTKIREALLSSKLDAANQYLGYEYFFSGKVMEGDKIGRTIGYPTINLKVNDANKLIPGNGVYAVHLQIKEAGKAFFTELPHLKGMMNIGYRPTIGGTKKMIEINIFDFERDIYNLDVTIYLKSYIRTEIKFDGLESLKKQLAQDKQQAILQLEKF
jgi:riboflavin kinase/FMN adenylyltransferase